MFSQDKNGNLLTHYTTAKKYVLLMTLVTFSNPLIPIFFLRSLRTTSPDARHFATSSHQNVRICHIRPAPGPPQRSSGCNLYLSIPAPCRRPPAAGWQNSYAWAGHLRKPRRVLSPAISERSQPCSGIPSTRGHDGRVGTPARGHVHATLASTELPSVPANIATKCIYRYNTLLMFF